MSAKKQAAPEAQPSKPIRDRSVNALRDLLWDQIEKLTSDKEVDLKRMKEIRSYSSEYLSSVRVQLNYMRITGIRQPIPLLE